MLQFMGLQRVGHNLETECFPGSSAGKDLPAMQGRPGFDPWDGKMPWRRKRLPTPVFQPGEFHGLYSPWGCKELDTTGQLSLSLSYGPITIFLIILGLFFVGLFLVLFSAYKFL